MISVAGQNLLFADLPQRLCHEERADAEAGVGEVVEHCPERPEDAGTSRLDEQPQRTLNVDFAPTKPLRGVRKLAA
nr:hypothetical protein [Sorangium cellulosum]